MSKEISRFTEDALPYQSEQQTLAERLTQRNSIVMYGGASSGMLEFEALMHQTGNPEVKNLKRCSHTTEILDAFFGTGRFAPAPTPGSSESFQEMTIPRGVLMFYRMVTRENNKLQIVPTPQEYISDLCDRYGVESVYVGMDEYATLPDRGQADHGQTDLGRLGTMFAALPHAPLE